MRNAAVDPNKGICIACYRLPRVEVLVSLCYVTGCILLGVGIYIALSAQDGTGFSALG
jgi:hypothetical protein